MSLWRWYSVSCNVCNDWLRQQYDTSADARAAARRRGWKRRERRPTDTGAWTTNVDVCPACSAKENAA